MLAIFVILTLLIFKINEIFISAFLTFPIIVWPLLGPAQIIVAAIFGAMGFIWIIVLPYVSLKLIRYFKI